MNSKIVIILAVLLNCAHATMQVNSVPLSPNSLYLETSFWDCDFSSGQQSVKETYSGQWPSGTFDVTLEISKTGRATCSLTTAWKDGWSSTATFSNFFTWGYICPLKPQNPDGSFSLSAKTIEGLTFSTAGRYDGTLYPYSEEQIADGEFVFRMDRIAQTTVPTVPESGSAICLLLGSLGMLALRHSTSKA